MTARSYGVFFRRTPVRRRSAGEPRILPRLLLLCALVACGDAGGDPDPSTTVPDSARAVTTQVSDSAGTVATQVPVAATADTTRSRYTSLENCELVLSVPEEAGYSVRHCQGVGALLKLSESDGRQDLALLMADGSEYRLHLPSTVGAGFSALGPRAEWRFTASAASPDTPSHLIVRYNVVENPLTPERDVSYLVVSRVSPTGACVIGIVEPGPSQNERARDVAEANGACLSPDAPAGAQRGAASSIDTGDGGSARGNAQGQNQASLALEGEGLRIFLAPSGSARPLPFGTPMADALAVLEAVHGDPPREQGDNGECNASYATWDSGLTVWFVRDDFVGWSIRDGALQTASGIGVGSTRAELQGVYDARIRASSLGEEFSAGGLAGVLASSAPDARVTNLWAGIVCIAR